MRTAAELKAVLDSHRKWAMGELGGSRAYLSGADLSGAGLSGADLSGANLIRANLSGANLSGADLSGADLSRAYLNGAYLNGANLTRADLIRANLSGTDLSGAYLSGADLSGADLSGADLNWQIRDLIAELLFRWAGDDVSRRMVAGLVLISRDWCWEQLLAVEHPCRADALAYLVTLGTEKSPCPPELLAAADACRKGDV